MSVADLVAGAISFLLTLMVLSYLIGDNPLFRLAIHIFIGVAAGYTGAVALRSVIVPRLRTSINEALSGGDLGLLFLAVIPALLGLILLTKLSRNAAWVGSPTMAYLVGVGAAAAIGGSLFGTMFPQVGSTINLFDLQTARASGISGAERLLEGSIILVGSVTTLLYFHFGARARPEQPPQRNRYIGYLAWGGQGFIAVTFGVLFAGVYAAALTALIERWSFILSFLRSLLAFIS